MTFGLKAALWYARGGSQPRATAPRAGDGAGGKDLRGGGDLRPTSSLTWRKKLCHLLGLEPAPVSSQICPARPARGAYDHAGHHRRLAGEGGGGDSRAAADGDRRGGGAASRRGRRARAHAPQAQPGGVENVTGLARLIRANAGAALENVALWHERDISHSSAERVILPDSTILLDYMLHRMSGLLEGLRVYPERMRENMERSFGLTYSSAGAPPSHRERAAAPAGLMRSCSETPCGRGASAPASATSRRRWGGDGAPDPHRARRVLRPAWYLRNVDAVYRRLNLL